jgi:hypothetical protein
MGIGSGSKTLYQLYLVPQEYETDFQNSNMRNSTSTLSRERTLASKITFFKVSEHVESLKILFWTSVSKEVFTQEYLLHFGDSIRSAWH